MLRLVTTGQADPRSKDKLVAVRQAITGDRGQAHSLLQAVQTMTVFGLPKAPRKWGANLTRMPH
jgi:hypothetical protein